MPRESSQRGFARAFADQLLRVGEARTRESRTAAFDLLARDVMAAGQAPAVLGRLLAADANARRFALEIAARLPPPLPADLVNPIVKHLGRAAVPSRVRIAVAALLVRTVARDSPVVGRVLDGLEKKVSRRRAADRLRRLEELIPPHAAVTRRREDLAAPPVTACPRCGERLDRAGLVKHLWESHQLLFDRGKARDPWHVVEGWVAEYARAPQGELLDRCCDLAQALDPAAGITRVHQLLLASGSGDEEAHSTLRAEAAGQNASLCPNCFALVPIPVAPEPARVIVGPGRVEGEGYHVDLSDHGLLTRLAVDAPAGPIYRGPEPGRSLTRRGAVLLVVLPLAILAGFAAVMPTVFAIPPVAPVAALLLVATLIYAATRVLIDDRGDLAGRAIDRAWAILVPPLIRADPRPGPARFIAGLAEASVGRGRADMRQDVLVRAVEVFENSRTVQSFVTPLHALQIEDDRRAGGDDLSALADRAAASFEGRLPLDHAEILIDRLRGDSADRTRRARLRVLLLTRAFLTGLEPEDLRVLGRLYPHLGSAYASEDRNGLARLRLLWLYRSRRLWQRVGSATSVFDLARYPTLTDLYLRRRPDLLLFQPSGDTDVTTDPILICEEGVVFRDSIVREGDADIRVRAKPAGKGGGFELQMGDEKYAFGDDPAVLARRLQEWARFLFQEFLPRARLLGMRRSARGDRLIAQKSAICPACLRQFLALRGEVGLTAPLNADEDDE